MDPRCTICGKPEGEQGFVWNVPPGTDEHLAESAPGGVPCHPECWEAWELEAKSSHP